MRREKKNQILNVLFKHGQDKKVEMAFYICHSVDAFFVLIYLHCRKEMTNAFSHPRVQKSRK
jgi:hypothetical protein